MHMLIKSQQTYYNIKVAKKILMYKNLPSQVFWQSMAM